MGEGKIKLTDISGATLEGTPAAINKIFKSSNCDISKFITQPKALLSNKQKALLLLIPIIPFIGVTIVMLFITNNAMLFTVLAVFEILFAGGIVCCIHGFFKSIGVTLFASFFVVLVILLSFHIYTPEQAATDMKNKLDKVELPSNSK